jgi:DUF1016 N-terminal domain
LVARTDPRGCDPKYRRRRPPGRVRKLVLRQQQRLDRRIREPKDLEAVYGPPPAAVSDVFGLLGKVDDVIIVGRVGRNRRDVAQRLHETLTGAGIPSGAYGNICSMHAPSPARPGDAPPAGYPELLAEVKARIAAARTRAALAVNSELIRLYWDIGHEILEREQREGWGAKVIDRLAADLRREFPEMTGLSRSNLHYMRQLAAAWPDSEVVPQPVGQLPWGHYADLGIMPTCVREPALGVVMAA